MILPQAFNIVANVFFSFFVTFMSAVSTFVSKPKKIHKTSPLSGGNFEHKITLLWLAVKNHNTIFWPLGKLKFENGKSLSRGFCFIWLCPRLNLLMFELNSKNHLIVSFEIAAEWLLRRRNNPIKLHLHWTKIHILWS